LPWGTESGRLVQERSKRKERATFKVSRTGKEKGCRSRGTRRREVCRGRKPGGRRALKKDVITAALAEVQEGQFSRSLARPREGRATSLGGRVTKAAEGTKGGGGGREGKKLMIGGKKGLLGRTHAEKKGRQRPGGKERVAGPTNSTRTIEGRKIEREGRSKNAKKDLSTKPEKKKKSGRGTYTPSLKKEGILSKPKEE